MRVISSRTPDGLPNRCPVCGQEVRIEPSRPAGDAPCPHCGALLWLEGPLAQSKEPVPKSGQVWLTPCIIWFVGLMAFAVVLATAITFLILMDFPVFKHFGPMEVGVLSILSILLFGRKIPEVGRWLGKTIVSKRKKR